jgi:hypothetical protein
MPTSRAAAEGNPSSTSGHPHIGWGLIAAELDKIDALCAERDKGPSAGAFSFPQSVVCGSAPKPTERTLSVADQADTAALTRPNADVTCPTFDPYQVTRPPFVHRGRMQKLDWLTIVVGTWTACVTVGAIYIIVFT